MNDVFTERYIQDLTELADKVEQEGTTDVEKLTAINTKLLIKGITTPDMCALRHKAFMESYSKKTDMRSAIVQGISTAPPWLLIMGFLIYTIVKQGGGA